MANTKVRTPADLGKLIRLRRRDVGLTQAQLAQLAGVGNRFLSELERGKPTAAVGLVLQVASVLGLEIFLAPRGGVR